jgi:transposase
MNNTRIVGSATEAPPSHDSSSLDREREMFRLRTVEGLTLGAIAERFGVGPERTRQLINHHVRRTTERPPDPVGLTRTAKAIRRAANLARAQAHAGELLNAWRKGQTPEEIAKTFGLRCRCVARVVRSEATSSDRAARAYARTLAREQKRNGTKG